MAAKANPYGVTIAVFNTSPYAYSAQLFPDIATIGLGCVRFQQSWSLIEGTKGVYNWSALDDMVGRCNANGLFIQFPIRGAPAWYMTTLVNPGQTNRTTCNTNFPNDRIYNMDARRRACSLASLLTATTARRRPIHRSLAPFSSSMLLRSATRILTFFMIVTRVP